MIQHGIYNENMRILYGGKNSHRVRPKNQSEQDIAQEIRAHFRSHRP